MPSNRRKSSCCAPPQEATAPQVTLTPEEREEALAWLTAPDLIGRLREAFSKSGLIGEETNTLVAYLACVSRKLERPLAVIIQSASAAGKTTLMDAVLNFFPEEDRVKYSAMTGQSLYYLGETSLKHKILAVVEEAGAERAEQTERIHRVQRERRTLAGLIAKEERKDLLKKLRNAQRLLSPV